MSKLKKLLSLADKKLKKLEILVKFFHLITNEKIVKLYSYLNFSAFS